MADRFSNRLTRNTVKFTSMAIATAGFVLLVFLLYTVATTTIPFDNDEANHAVDGWQVYWALVHLNPSDLYRAIVNQSFYPPVHSIFVAISYLLAGPGIAASRMPSVVIAAVTVLGMAGLVWQISRSRSVDPWLCVSGATLSATLAIFNLNFILSSTLCMLEMTGAMLGVLLVAIAYRIDRVGKRRSAWVAASAIVATTIFLTKYSFGLFFGCGLVAAFFGANFPGTLVRRQKLQFDRPIRRDIAIVLGIYAIVIGVWVFVTHRPTMWLFFSGHPSYAPFWSLENLLFYPKAWLMDYSSHAIVGVFALILAIVGATSYSKQLEVRVVTWSVVAAIGILTVSTTNSPRHLFVVVPTIWMLAGLGLTEVLRLLRYRGGERAIVRAIALLWGLLTIGAIEPAIGLHGELMANFEGLPVYTQMQDFGLENVDLDRPGLMLGWTSDQYRLLALRWRAAVLSGKSLDDLDFDYFPFDKRERSLHRTHRKPQMPSVDRDFPQEPLRAVLDRGYYAWAIVTRPLDEPPDDSLLVLQGYPHVIQVFEGWETIVYQL
ncbi:MAG: hypothetical protein SWY16_05950 [Cyanobacteriota bacterium]|nr:hypothetical protein [Cyanobacteriota bacterium]